jgi:hypothetical protein
MERDARLSNEQREAFRQETLLAWQEYEATGAHLSEEEADAWLARLENGEDVDPPECHVAAPLRQGHE